MIRAARTPRNHALQPHRGGREPGGNERRVQLESHQRIGIRQAERIVNQPASRGHRTVPGETSGRRRGRARERPPRRLAGGAKRASEASQPDRADTSAHSDQQQHQTAPQTPARTGHPHGRRPVTRIAHAPARSPLRPQPRRDQPRPPHPTRRPAPPPGRPHHPRRFPHPNPHPRPDARINHESPRDWIDQPRLHTQTLKLPLGVPKRISPARGSPTPIISVRHRAILPSAQPHHAPRLRSPLSLQRRATPTRPGACGSVRPPRVTWGVVLADTRCCFTSWVNTGLSPRDRTCPGAPVSNADGHDAGAGTHPRGR